MSVNVGLILAFLPIVGHKDLIVNCNDIMPIKGGKMQGKRYKEKEDKIIHKMREQHFTVPAIAQRLNRSVYSVRSRITTLRSLRKIR